jgi:hypothetical protein
MFSAMCELGFFIPGDGILHSRRLENLKCYLLIMYIQRFATIQLL